MMNGRGRSRISRFGIALMVALIALVPIVRSAPIALAEIDGNTYTSSQPVYTFTWTDDWYVLESTDDSVTVGDGITIAYTSGFEEPGFSSKRGIIEAWASIRTDPTKSNVVRDPDTGVTINLPADGDWESMQIASTMTYDDGTTDDLLEFYAVRTIVPGESSILFYAGTLDDYFAAEAPAIEELLAGVAVPSLAEGPDQGTGEPAPVFASGPWRVAVAGAALFDERAELGLPAKSGKQWVVVLADVTGWSTDAETFVGREFLLRSGSGKPAKAAPVSTVAVEQSLGLPTYGEGLTLPIGAGETVRLALVFAVPADAQDLILVHDEAAMPIDGALTVTLAPDAMPAPATLPDLIEAQLVSASDAKTIRVQSSDAVSSQRIQLLGIQPLPDDGCGGKEAEKMLDGLAGEQVLIEEDTRITDGGSSPSRYVWLVNDDGSRTLLNASLIADGLAEADDLPADARFSGWFQESERAAKAAPVGVWADCKFGEDVGSSTSEPTTSPTDTPSPTSSATARATATPTRTPTAQATATPTKRATAVSDVIALDVVMDDFTFSPATLTVPANSQVTIRLTNRGSVSHSFAIDGLDTSVWAIAPGASASINVTTGAPGLHVFYCTVPGHVEQGMVGTLIVVDSTSD